jgi:hypothetical protein
MIAEEILARANGNAQYEWNEDVAEARCSLPGGARVKVAANETQREVTATIEWMGSGTDDRKNVGRYLGPRCDQASAALRRGGWVVATQSVSTQTAHLVATRSCIGLAQKVIQASEGIRKALEHVTFT